MNETIDQAAVQTVDEAQRRNIPVQHVEGQTQPMMGSEQVDITRVVPQVEMNGDAQILTFPEQPPLPEAPPQPEDPQETASTTHETIKQDIGPIPVPEAEVTNNVDAESNSEDAPELKLVPDQEVEAEPSQALSNHEDPKDYYEVEAEPSQALSNHEDPQDYYESDKNSTTEVQAKSSTNEASTDPNDISDIVNVDVKGRGHVSGSHNEDGSAKNGQFLSQHEMDMIAENQDLIRNNTQEVPPEDTPDPNEVVDVVTPPNETVTDPPDPNEVVTPPVETPVDTVEVPPVVAETAPHIVAFEEAKEEYDSAIKAYAHAKIRSERMFAGKDAKELLSMAGEKLELSHSRLLEASDGLMAAENQSIDELLLMNNEERTNTANSLTELIKQRATAQNEGNYDNSLDDQINQLAQYLSALEVHNDKVNKVKEERPKEVEAYKANLLIEMSTAVDNAMLAERTQAHPKLAKVGNWLKTHPKTRIAVGLGLAAIGVVGAATFNAPLVAVSMAGSATLRGYGSYNFARGIGEMLASGKMNKADLKTVEDYLTVSEKQSATRKNSKRAGAVVATALVAAPLVGRLLDQFHSTNGFNTRPRVASAASNPATAATPEAVVPAPLDIAPTGDGMLPWTFGQDVLHQNISSPDVLDKLVNNPLGIHFQGNGLGGGMGAIQSVDIPGQGTFTDLGHINGAMQAILGTPS